MPWTPSPHGLRLIPRLVTLGFGCIVARLKLWCMAVRVALWAGLMLVRWPRLGAMHPRKNGLIFNFPHDS